MKKKATGKPPRKKRESRENEPIPPFNEKLRYTIEQACHYLHISRPTLYKLIEAKSLQAFKEGRRTYIYGRSIAKCSKPPAGVTFKPLKSHWHKSREPVRAGQSPDEGKQRKAGDAHSEATP